MFTAPSAPRARPAPSAAAQDAFSPGASANLDVPGGARILVGLDYWKLKKDEIREAIYWEADALSNPHIGIAGTSGSGKTHWIRKFLAAFPGDVEADVFDYHGDIEIPGACTVLFSESTRYGYNPLALNPDPHYGGVRRGVMDVVETLDRASMKLGDKQRNVLAHLLYDTYAQRGILPDDPDTWRRHNATRVEADQAIETRDRDAIVGSYPGLEDVVRLAKRKLKALWMGIEDNPKNNGRAALTAFDDACKASAAAHKATSRAKMVSEAIDTDVKELEAKAGAAQDKALSAMRAFFEAIETGREFEEVVKYHSKDVLLSVITRLENLISVGIFSQNPPPFGDARVRRYNLRPIAQSENELKMFVYFRLRAIIREEMQKGESHGRIRRLIVLDESKKFNSDDVSNPLNVISNEMRKFGVALLMAAQSPDHFSDDFVTNAGTLLCLNLATTDWNDAARKLKIEPKQLQHLKPQQTGVVRMLRKGEAARFRQVQF